MNASGTRKKIASHATAGRTTTGPRIRFSIGIEPGGPAGGRYASTGPVCLPAIEVLLVDVVRHVEQLLELVEDRLLGVDRRVVQDRLVDVLLGGLIRPHVTNRVRVRCADLC